MGNNINVTNIGFVVEKAKLDGIKTQLKGRSGNANKLEAMSTKVETKRFQFRNFQNITANKTYT